MDSKKIDELIERYWNCATTQEEEAELKNYFNSTPNIPPHLTNIAPLFQYFNKEANVKIKDSNFDLTVINKLKKEVKRGNNVRKIKPYFRNYIKVAAAVVAILAVSFIVKMKVLQSQKSDLILVEDTYKNPKEAYIETKKALLLIASNMNHGKREVEKISMFSKAEEKIKND